MFKLASRLVFLLALFAGCRTTPAVRDYLELPDSELSVHRDRNIGWPHYVEGPTIVLVDYEINESSPSNRVSAPEKPADTDKLPSTEPRRRPSLLSFQSPKVTIPAGEYTVPLYDASCKMTSHQVACAAAKNATLGNALKQHVSAQSFSCGDSDCDNSCSREVRSKLLKYRSIYDRNQAASKALMLFYGLAEINQQLDLLTKASKELARNEDRVAKLKKEDIEVPFDATELKRSRVELESKREELELKKSQANKQLLVLISDECTREFVSPNVELKLSKFDIDAELAVAEGMESRSDLGLLRMLDNCLNNHTLKSINQALMLTSAALGFAECPPTLRDLLRIACRGPQPVDERQIAHQRLQIQSLANDLTRQIDSEIRSAIVEIETRMRQVVLAESTVAAWNQRVEDLAVLRELEKATPFEITNATLQRMTAESDLIHARSQVRMATVKLGTAQGRLALDCGYVLPSPFCCCNRTEVSTRQRRRFHRAR
jgi:hypothetical protein